MRFNLLFVFILSFSALSCKPKAADQNQSSEEISQNKGSGFFLSDDHGLRTEEISKLISGELDDFVDADQKELMRQLNAQSKTPLKNGNIKNLAVVGAGPAGLMQGLLAFEQGYHVHLIEKRQQFERGHIFQIDENDFNKNVKRYLSPGAFNKLTELGVLQSYAVEGSNPQRRIVTVATRDLESILYGVVKEQQRLSDSKIQITKGAELSPDRINAQSGELIAEIVEDIEGETVRRPHRVKADAIVVATGAGPGSKPYFDQFSVQRVDEFDAKKIRPIGVLVETKYPVGSVTPEFLDRLNASLAKRFPVANTLNFLRLDGQGKLQINVQITSEQFQGLYGSTLGNDGNLDWNKHWQQIGDDTKKFFREEILAVGSDDTPELKWLREQKIGVWVAEKPISRVDKPAVLIDGKVPLIFVGDAQGNNWFLNGDGNPREHQMASIVLEEFERGGDLDSIVKRIEGRSLAFVDQKNLEILDSRVLSSALVDSSLPNNVIPFDPRGGTSVPDVKTKPVVKPKPKVDAPKVRIKL